VGTDADTEREAVVRTGKLNVKQVESILKGREADRVKDKDGNHQVKDKHVNDKWKRYFGDGGGLWLTVTKRDTAGKPIAASYVYRFMLYGKSREMGLGSAWDIKLADAREAARLARVRVRTAAVDVVEEKRADVKAKRAAALIEQARRMTFKAAAEALIRSQEDGWRNDKHRYQWRQSLASYAYPVIGDVPVSDIDKAMVIRVLEPIWKTKTETASRLRGRIETVLSWAAAREFRPAGDNPARWKGHLEHLLARKSKIAPVEHHAALPYRDVGTFMAELRDQKGIAARALEFLVLNWSRTSEVIGARWEEVNEPEKLWTIPAERMKANKPHKVPLCDRAMEIIAEMRDILSRRPSAYVFQGLKDGQPLSNMSLLMLLRRMGHESLTAHGFRSSARTWAAEQTAFPAEVAEMALAHTVSDKTVVAYLRGDGLKKRHQLAQAWGRYCATPPAIGGGKVVALAVAV
jgi:integrase